MPCVTAGPMGPELVFFSFMRRHDGEIEMEMEIKRESVCVWVGEANAKCYGWISL